MPVSIHNGSFVALQCSGHQLTPKCSSASMLLQRPPLPAEAKKSDLWKVCLCLIDFPVHTSLQPESET